MGCRLLRDVAGLSVQLLSNMAVTFRLRQFVLSLDYPGTFPQLGLVGATWRRSNEGTWKDSESCCPVCKFKGYMR